MKTALIGEGKVLSGTLKQDTEVIGHGQEQQRQLLDNGKITEKNAGVKFIESHIPYCIIQLNYFKFQSLMFAGIYW